MDRKNADEGGVGHSIELDLVFDRIADSQLARAFESLALHETWCLPGSEIMADEISGHLCAGVVGPTEEGANDCEPDLEPAVIRTEAGVDDRR